MLELFVKSNGVRVGVVHEVNYINPVLSVCTEGQTDGANPNSIICEPEVIADNNKINAGKGIFSD